MPGRRSIGARKGNRRLNVRSNRVAATVDGTKNGAQRRMKVTEEILLRGLAFASGFIGMRDDRGRIVPRLMRNAGPLRGQEGRCEKVACESAQHGGGFYTRIPCSIISPGTPRARR
jgi:hypothetical protein